ncbi:hypothetical protein RJT34_07297 [Clitoria ternatea]|uniref:non-specific serine/threonine protein kinase n=1 Tax=Clitoria ternatea TaxID=43366 RepID=A0AAN9PTG7_CLITE
MNPRTIFFPCSFLFHFHIILFTLLPTITFSSLDPKFEACEPKTCGNGLNISYPFYIQGKQQPFYGNPGFELSCNQGSPILNLVNSQYIIQEIFYDNHSFRVSNIAFSEPNTSSCIASTQSLTVGRYRFQLAPNQRDLFLFYGCNLTSLPQGLRENGIGCSEENRNSWVVGMAKEDEDLELVKENCKGETVNATVEDVKDGVKEALKNGFLLNWNATNRTECANNGGRCGFDPDPATYAFRCYCPHGVHVFNCDPS